MSDSSIDRTSKTLAQANLLRMRGQWEEAISACMDVMRYAPHSATAHSLLGDIYSDQSNLDEAIRWYCMALDLEPSCQSDRAKLSRLVEAKRQTLIAADQRDPHTTLRLRRMRRLCGLETTWLGHGLVWRADRTLRALTIVVALAMLVTIIAAPIISIDRQRSRNAADLAGSNRQFTAAPVYLQPVVPKSLGPQVAASAGPTTLRDPFDQALVDNLHNDTALLYQGIQIVDAQSDPRTGHAVLTFLENPSNAPPGDLRTQILSNSLRLAAAATTRTPTNQINQFTIRCLLLSSPESQDSGATLPPVIGTPITATTPLVFVADIDRASVPTADISKMSSQSMQALFTSAWYASSLQ